MAKKGRNHVEYIDAEDRFRKIANRRAKTLVKQINLIRGMLPQPSYAISKEDAGKLAKYINDAVTPLVTELTKISEGQPLRGKKEIGEVF